MHTLPYRGPKSGGICAKVGNQVNQVERLQRNCSCACWTVGANIPDCIYIPSIPYMDEHFSCLLGKPSSASTVRPFAAPPLLTSHHSNQVPGTGLASPRTLTSDDKGMMGNGHSFDDSHVLTLRTKHICVLVSGPHVNIKPKYRQKSSWEMRTPSMHLARSAPGCQLTLYLAKLSQFCFVSSARLSYFVDGGVVGGGGPSFDIQLLESPNSSDTDTHTHTHICSLSHTQEPLLTQTAGCKGPAKRCTPSPTEQCRKLIFIEQKEEMTTALPGLLSGLLPGHSAFVTAWPQTDQLGTRRAPKTPSQCVPESFALFFILPIFLHIGSVVEDGMHLLQPGSRHSYH